MRFRSILIPTIVPALTLSACLADLPAPAHCPPSAKNPGLGSDCQTAIGNSTVLGCAADPQTVACLTGSRTSCTCGANECPPPPAACFPRSECPPFVTGGVRGSVTCIHLAAEAILGNTTGCVCGCVSCASTCDGIGPVIATRLPNQSTDPVLTVANLNTLLPPAGRLGFYMRVRGFSQFPPVIGSAEPAGGPTSAAQISLVGSATEFTEVLAYDPEKSLSWTTAEGRPSAFAIFPPQGPSLFEIDCIIPFVVTTP